MQLLPENHVADEAVVLLHGEQAAKGPLGNVVFAQPREDKDGEAAIPEPLERIGLQSGRDEAIVLAQRSGIAVRLVAQHEFAHLPAQLFLSHGTSSAARIALFLAALSKRNHRVVDPNVNRPERVFDSIGRGLERGCIGDVER
jgi:hypothetical protein